MLSTSVPPFDLVHAPWQYMKYAIKEIAREARTKAAASIRESLSDASRIDWQITCADRAGMPRSMQTLHTMLTACGLWTPAQA
eukprot:8559410-Alexandrium_andersonii.AAC.1